MPTHSKEEPKRKPRKIIRKKDKMKVPTITITEAPKKIKKKEKATKPVPKLKEKPVKIKLPKEDEKPKQKKVIKKSAPSIGKSLTGLRKGEMTKLDPAELFGMLPKELRQIVLDPKTTGVKVGAPTMGEYLKPFAEELNRRFGKPIDSPIRYTNYTNMISEVLLYDPNKPERDIPKILPDKSVAANFMILYAAISVFYNKITNDNRRKVPLRPSNFPKFLKGKDEFAEELIEGFPEVIAYDRELEERGKEAIDKYIEEMRTFLRTYTFPPPLQMGNLGFRYEDYAFDRRD